jgi:DNA recombination protein RmuC
MDSLIVIALFLVALGAILAAMFWIWSRTSTRIDGLQERIMESSQLQKSTTESFGEIQRTLGGLNETTRQMRRLGEEISGLGDLLKAPKLRGGVGELLLNDLLSQALSPSNFHMNHTFRSGERVDAVISLKAGMVPVDAKFPLESFQRMLATDDEDQRTKHKREFVRAVKGHINTIAQKYILPDEGTFDFALMYIPAENVYYETIIKDESLGESQSLLAHALEKRVIPVSPNSFYAYLQAIALGLKGMRVEKQAQQILATLSRLEGDFARFKAEYDVLGGHLDRARNKFEEAGRNLSRFEEKLTGVKEPLPYSAPPAVESEQEQ